MCGRFANHLGAMHGWTDILSDWPQQADLGFNIAPTQFAPVLTSSGFLTCHWGLLPSWLKNNKPSFSTFNARLATLAEKPTFQNAWQSQQRCIVPVLGYFEWRMEQGHKQAYFVRRKDQHAILFGGLFETANHYHPDSFTVITRPAEGSLAPLHHAMPLMFDEKQAKQWLQVSTDESLSLAWHDYADDYHYYPVSNQVNSVAHQGDALITPTTRFTDIQAGFDF